MSNQNSVKETLSNLFMLRDFFWAVTGVILGFMLDRFWTRIESKPRFRIQVGWFEDIGLGKGHTLTITNVGFSALPKYEVVLFHPQRGSLNVFYGSPRETLVFPQHPDQWNEFYCVTHPRQQQPHYGFFKDWFLRVRNEIITAPSFTDFSFRLKLEHSERILFEDEELGNSIAKTLFEDIAGGKVEQDVKCVFYKSKAPFWIEWIRRFKTRRMLRVK